MKKYRFIIFLLIFNLIITPILANETGYEVDKKVMSINSEIVEQKEQERILEFNDDDLKFSKFADFRVGLDSVDKFFAYYGKHLKSYYSINKSISEGIFYGSSDKYGFPYYMIFITVDRKTKIVKEVLFTESEKRKDNMQMKTFRGITTGSTLKEMYEAYGDNCETNVIKNNNFNLVNCVYSFTTKSKVKAKIIFYAEYDKNDDIKSAIIDGIRIIIE